MIEIAQGSDVVQFVDRITAGVSLYSEIVICSPFIDDGWLPRLMLLSKAVSHSHSALRIVTTDGPAGKLASYLIPPLSDRRTSLVIRPRLHAKLYLAMAAKPGVSEAIVTSANFTDGGVRSNIELGVRITSSSEPGRRVIQQVHQFAHLLAA